MIARPTTEELLLDCARVLQDTVLPAVPDEITQVRLAMLTKVLGNAAVRAGHEIAWMREETAAVTAFAQRVAAVRPGAVDLDRARAALADGPHASLHLADVTEVYRLAGDVLSAALDVTLAPGHDGLVEEGEALLAARLVHEDAIVGGWDSGAR